ncbi:sialic acid-binding Ig-like lectin 10 isoform X2 [Simochromis diagramma]|uniref:sialic acid-binding Ig-like lectin 10 isoform X2 n=1 Tax=Simochromis diagramma TaxID=43689 RepID=UPI001A7EF5CA|nr:sialic acid-binding Ig-like lectin 10 isoform X2 [Simochromis diagramma]
MFVLIWAIFLLCVCAETGTSQQCSGQYCITLSETLTAEAGLCVVIPCSFTTGFGFKPKHIVWYKCEANSRCVYDDEIIFHSKNNIRVQYGFEGRVSLLEPDIRQNNCSIIINDLKESDSGLYRIRANGEINWREDGFTSIQKTTVSVEGLSQKPRVKIPTLTEGQQATLTCVAPGLCSGSAPEITWTWRGAGGTESYITGNSTSFRTKTLTAFTQRHISTLTFNSSAEHHNTNVTCKIRFTGEKTTEEGSTLKVNYVKEVNITGGTNVKEGETLNLTCSVESFPPSLIMWSKLGSDITLHNDTGSASLSIINATTGHSGQYVCTAKHMNNTLQENIDITVMYIRTPQIIGNTIIKEGDVLNLTCSVESFPPSLIMWSKLGSDITLHNDTGSATLSIINATTGHSGQYVCTAKHMNNTLQENIDITVMYTRTPQITGNTIIKEGDVLNLTCSVDSFPPALIMWRDLSSKTNSKDTGAYTDLQNDSGSATLVIQNVTAEDSGQYTCTATHPDTTVTSSVSVIVSWFSKIQDVSECVLQAEVLTCVCISEGFPLPTIKWPLLGNHKEYAIKTTVSNHTVNSTVSLKVKNYGNSTVECVSNNEKGEAKKNLMIRSVPDTVADSSVLNVGYLEIIIAFLIGVVLSAVVCCLIKKCSRKKTKNSGNLDETLEMVTSQDDPQHIYDGQETQDNQSNPQEEVEDESVAAEKDVPELSGAPQEVEYADIDFSLLKRNSKSERKQERTKTEYAEIKKAIKDKQEDEMVKGEEEEMMTEMDLKQSELEKEKEEDEPVYSTVNDVIDKI